MPLQLALKLARLGGPEPDHTIARSRGHSLTIRAEDNSINCVGFSEGPVRFESDLEGLLLGAQVPQPYRVVISADSQRLAVGGKRHGIDKRRGLTLDRVVNGAFRLLGAQVAPLRGI